MKHISTLTRIMLVALALGTAGVTAAMAADSTPASTASSSATTLTDDQKAQLKKDRDEALKANPDLQAEKDALAKKNDALKAAGTSASDADKAALKTERQAFEEKLHAAMVAADPTAAPLIDKMKAVHASK